MYRLTPEQEAIVSKAKAIANSVIASHAADVDEKARYPSESMKALADAGRCRARRMAQQRLAECELLRGINRRVFLTRPRALQERLQSLDEFHSRARVTARA